MYEVDNVTQMKEEEQEQGYRIIHTYGTSNDSPTLIFLIPKDIREMYDLIKPTSLYLIPKKDYLILKKWIKRVSKFDQ